MTKTEELFQEAIKISAEVVKDINEDDYDLDDKDIIDLNDKVSNIQCELLELPMDFEVKNRKEYCKKLLGKDYFSDNRCWDYLSDVVYEIENDIGSMIINESITERSEENKKSLKESKEFFVGSKTWQGYDVYMIEDGKKYYLSKLAKNIEDSSWSSDHTYAKHWKDKSRAEEIVNMLNSELKENKESIKERSEENEIIVSELQDTVEYFCGLYEEDKELKGRALESLKNAVERLEVFNAIGSIYQWGVEVLNKCGIKYKGLKESKKVINEKVDSKYKYVFNHTKDEYEIVQFDDYNFEILAIPNDKSVFSNDLPKLKIEKTYIYDTCVNNKDITLFVGIVEELGWCFIAFDKLANNNNIFAYYISGKTKEGAYHSFHEYKSEYNLKCEESKKSSRKSLNESKNIKKSLEIIRRKIIELVNDETIQDEFNDIFDLGGSSFDTVDDWFETTVHNVLHDVLKDWTIGRIPF